jgi:hypothetical protein
MSDTPHTNGTTKIERVVSIAIGILAIGGVLWALAIAPIKADQRALQMQMDAISVIQNVRAQYAHTFDQLLWKRVYGDDLPSLDYWPNIGSSNDGRE